MNALVINVPERRAISTLVAAINFNSLPVFLIANLMTGAVNLSIRTLLQPTTTAFLIVMSSSFVAAAPLTLVYLLTFLFHVQMSAYLFVVCAVATVCYRYQRRIKFW
jgi:hypothetical protein